GRDRPRALEPRGRGRGLPLSPPVPSVQRSADRRTHARPVDQHPRHRGAHRGGGMDLLPRRRGTERLQVWLVAVQVLSLGSLVVAALVQVAGGTAFDPTPVSIDWFNPFSAGDFSTVAAAVSLSIFLFWGWDTVITMNEEAKDPEKTPGRAALLTILAI